MTIQLALQMEIDCTVVVSHLSIFKTTYAGANNCGTCQS
jgi:hypothetical protein